MMKNVLIVDDEKPFLLSLMGGLEAYATDFNVITALNGKYAVDILKTMHIDLVLTDIKMPEMDGLELLSYMSKEYPNIPVIVMTAFGTTEIEDNISALGAVKYLEKPINLSLLIEKILEVLESQPGGSIRGITLPAFLQLVEAEKNTCCLKITSRGKTGYMYFFNGTPVDAKTQKLHGKEAAYDIVCWENPTIEIKHFSSKKKNTIGTSLTHLLMEGFRINDEKKKTSEGKEEAGKDEEEALVFDEVSITERSDVQNPKENDFMSAQETLKELATIEGFAGAGCFTPTGETLSIFSTDIDNIKEIGILANNVLMNAQKASLEMGTGRGQLVHIQTESGCQIIVRCLNEGTDPLKSQPGKAHIHLVLVLKNDSSLGMAKMKVASVAEKLASDFRM
ncbi:MAG: response regulator [Nitrospirota bacterium]|nr:response regulator [Nitrospirota bacterium]